MANSDYLIKQASLTAIGNGIRSVNAETAQYTPAVMASKLDDIKGEIDDQTSLIDQIKIALANKTANTADATATASDILVGKTAYARNDKITGTMPVGVQGTPTATKGTVSGNSITITPQCTDSTGYIEGTTKTGTPVTVSASELVSGQVNITNTNSINVTNYATAKIVDANLIAGNIKKDAVVLGITGTYEGGGSGELFYSNDSIDELPSYFFMSSSNITGFSGVGCRSIGDDAFYQCINLSMVNAPNTLQVGAVAFLSCTKLTNVNVSNVETIGEAAFSSCTALVTADCRQVKTIGAGAFFGCSKLNDLGNSNALNQCITIGSSAFQNCKSLTTIYLPSCTTINAKAFNGCTLLYGIYDTNKCTFIGTSAFYFCSRITSINFPACTQIQSYAFNSCTGLATASFGALTNIAGYAFYRCTNLLSLYLTGSTVPTLSNKNAFMSTPISTYTTSTGGVYGKIYVPASLLTAYKTATNWSVYSSRFVAI